MSYGAFGYKSVKWWRKLFFHLMLMCLANVSILFNKINRKKDHNHSVHEWWRTGWSRWRSAKYKWKTTKSPSNWEIFFRKKYQFLKGKRYKKDARCVLLWAINSLGKQQERTLLTSVVSAKSKCARNPALKISIHRKILPSSIFCHCI